MSGSIKRKKTKEKIGTILDTKVVRIIKERSLKEGRTISEIIQAAVLKYNEIDITDSEIRLQALNRFCSRQFNLKTSELRELLDEDIYEV